MQATAHGSLHVARSEHPVTPRLGTAVRVRDSTPADLRYPSSYPAAAECLECGRPACCERYLLADWHHSDPQTA